MFCWNAAVSRDRLALMILTGLTKYRDIGLLILRAGLGVFFIFHGWPKLMGGPEVWERVGGAMAHFGLGLFPEFWGLLAALTEVLGGLLLLLGFLFRPACIALFATMMVATVMLLQTDGDFTKWSHPAKMAVVFFAWILIGPGKYSVDRS